MQLPENFLQKAKVALHGVQGFVIFLAWAITIAIFTKPGSTDGRTRFYFALVQYLPSPVVKLGIRWLTFRTVLVLHPPSHLPSRRPSIQPHRTLFERIRPRSYRRPTRNLLVRRFHLRRDMDESRDQEGRWQARDQRLRCLCLGRRQLERFEVPSKSGYDWHGCGVVVSVYALHTLHRHCLS